MTDNEKKTAARPFFRAFYQGNRLRFALTLALTLLGIPITLMVSWILGALLDAASNRSMEQFIFVIKVFVPMFALYTVLTLGFYRAKAGFVCRALKQYKSLAFHKLSEKSISAFSQENTGRYLSTLTNDVTTIETNYLENSFVMIEQAILFVGSLAMMLWYSPLLAVIAIVLSILPIAVALLTGGVLTRREQEVSEKNEGFFALVNELLNGFCVI